MGQKNFKPAHKSKSFGRTFDGQKSWSKLYDTQAWRQYSQKFLSVNPNCYACNKKSEVTDHLVPHQGDKELFEKLDNHIPLCRICHNTVTGLFDKKYVKGAPVDDKINWLNRLRVPGQMAIRVLSTYFQT